jgi:hypothetical protein
MERKLFLLDKHVRRETFTHKMESKLGQVPVSWKQEQDKRSDIACKLCPYCPNVGTCQPARSCTIQTKPQPQSEFTRCLSKFHAAKQHHRTLSLCVTSLSLSLSLSKIELSLEIRYNKKLYSSECLILYDASYMISLEWCQACTAQQHIPCPNMPGGVISRPIK